MALAATRDVLAARDKWRHRGDERPAFAQAPQAGQESVWDYPRPPRIVADRRRVRVVSAGRVVAESTRALRVLETASPPTFYVPAEDVDADSVRRASGATHCEWKGLARTYDVAGVDAAAWTYVETYPEYASLAGHFGFYPAKLDCTVDGEAVVPQPGGYYGGWVTPEIVGPFKTGDPSTAWW